MKHAPPALVPVTAPRGRQSGKADHDAILGFRNNFKIRANLTSMRLEQILWGAHSHSSRPGESMAGMVVLRRHQTVSPAMGAAAASARTVDPSIRQPQKVCHSHRPDAASRSSAVAGSGESQLCVHPYRWARNAKINNTHSNTVSSVRTRGADADSYQPWSRN